MFRKISAFSMPRHSNNQTTLQQTTQLLSFQMSNGSAAHYKISINSAISHYYADTIQVTFFRFKFKAHIVWIFIFAIKHMYFYLLISNKWHFNVLNITSLYKAASVCGTAEHIKLSTYVNVLVDCDFSNEYFDTLQNYTKERN